MTREVLADGFVRLRSAVGIIDAKTGKVHHDVICLADDEVSFAEKTEPKKRTTSRKKSQS